MMTVDSLDRLETLQPGDHAACLCYTAEEHAEVLSAFLRQGLARGEKIRYLVDKARPDAILNALRNEGAAVDACLANGQLSFVFIEEVFGKKTFDPDGMIAWLEREEQRALKQGYSALRVTGEMGWVVRGLVHAEGLMEFELKLHAFLHHRKCLILCQYERQRFSSALLLYVLAVHPKIIYGTKVYNNCHFLPSPNFFDKDVPAVTLRHWLEELSLRKEAHRSDRCGTALCSSGESESP
jgi:hypothetical protein